MDSEQDPESLALHVLQRRKAGADWNTVAASIGLPVELCASMLADALLAMPDVPQEIEVRLDLARLDSLLVPVYRSASRGDAKAVDQALKILAQRGKMLAELADLGVAGIDPDELPADDVDDVPVPVVESAGAYLARVRRDAVASADGATVFQLVRNDDEGDNDDD